MHGRTRTWIAVTAAALVTILGAPVLLSGPAAAAGDPTLDNAIAITPPAGWVLAPSALSDAQVAEEEQIVAGAQHIDYKFASKEWTQPNATNQLVVTLWAYSAQEISQVKRQIEAERQVCGQGQTAVTGSVAGIPGSAQTSCSTAPPNGTTAGPASTTYDFTNISWFTGDTQAEVHAVGVPPAQVAADAREVAKAIPAGGFAVGSGSSSSTLLLIGAGIAIVAVAAVIVVRRRRQTGLAAPFAGAPQPFLSTAHSWNATPAYSPVDTASPAPATVARQPTEAMAPLPAFRPVVQAAPAAVPAAAPGWHPLPGDPTKTAYWDGTQWAAFRQWDGHQWVDAAAVPR
jgi:LPXTG-motif cell wall-anchored protein